MCNTKQKSEIAFSILKMEKCIQDLKDDLSNDQKDKENINALCESISSEIEEAVQMESFYQLPINAIVTIVDKVDFSMCSDQVKLLKSLVENVVKFHPNEPDVFHLFGAIKLDRFSGIQTNHLIDIIGSFTNSPLCCLLSSLHNEELQLPSIDTSYELQQEIKSLKTQIQELKSEKENKIQEVTKEEQPKVTNTLMKKPFFFEPNVFKAVEKNKLSSVQYHIEVLGVDPSVCNEQGTSLFDIALQSKSQEIKSYFASKFPKNFKQLQMEIKVVLIGPSSAKMTRLVTAMTDHTLDKDYSPIVGAGYFPLKINSHGKEIELQLWDTTGLERYKSLLPIYLRDSEIIYFCYKATKSESFEQLKSMASRIESIIANQKVIGFLIGIDSGKDKPITVTKEDINSFISQYHKLNVISSLTVNLKTHKGIDNLLKTTGDKINN